MILHSLAALSIRQRIEVKRMHKEDGISMRSLAKRFHTDLSTIQRWVKRESPLDRSSAPIKHRTVINPEYRATVVSYRKEHPNHGPIRIAQELKADFPVANRGTVLSILQAEGLTRHRIKRKKTIKHIPVGRHRIQMDIQQLPAIKGGKGFEYKITAIHLRTRLKYSEIHDNRESKTVAGVLRRALDLLPPFSSFGQITHLSSQ